MTTPRDFVPRRANGLDHLLMGCGEHGVALAAPDRGFIVSRRPREAMGAYRERRAAQAVDDIGPHADTRRRGDLSGQFGHAPIEKGQEVALERCIAERLSCKKGAIDGVCPGIAQIGGMGGVSHRWSRRGCRPIGKGVVQTKLSTSRDGAPIAVNAALTTFDIAASIWFPSLSLECRVGLVN